MKKILTLFILVLLFGSMIPAMADPAPPEKVKVAYVSSKDRNIKMAEAILAENATIAQYIELTNFTGTTYGPDVKTYDLSGYDVIILESLVDSVFADLKPELNDAIANGTVILVQSTTDPKTTGMNWLNKTVYEDCFKYPFKGNFEILLLQLAKDYGDYTNAIPAVDKTSVYGVYHPDYYADNQILFKNASEYLAWYSTDRGDGSHIYDPTVPTIGIMPSSNLSALDRDGPILDYLVREIEAQGCNALVGTFVSNATTDVSKTANHENYMINVVADGGGNFESGEVIVDSVISLWRGARLFSLNNELGQQQLESLGVPVLIGAQLYENKTKEEWENSPYGIFPTQIAYLDLAEQDGMIEPIVIAAKPKDQNGFTIDRNDPIDYQADWMVQRAIGWGKLSHTDNADKKIVIPYYAAEAGKANIGADPDYYMDGPGSILEILKALEAAGYDVGNDPLPAKEELTDLMVNYGYNVGTWAPGQLKKMVDDGYAVMLPADDYIAYFNTLDTDKKQAVNDLWGPAPGNIMVYENESGKYVVIPALTFGNVMITPAPLRGRDQSEAAMANTKDYPPTHQMLAAYFYFRDDSQYNANALVPTWSNLATLPGKQTGLSAKDWAALMIGDMPIIHPLPMDATGKTDKRRANMAVITFMTPAMVPGGLYGDLESLDAEIQSYKSAGTDDVKAAILNEIIRYSGSLGFDASLNISWNNIKNDSVAVDKTLTQIEKHIRTIEKSYIPYGDHTLGIAPTGDEFDEMVASMVAQNPGLTENEAENKINQCTDEIINLINALNGEYIPIGSTGDPINNPEALPTGKNPIQDDSRTIPSETVFNGVGTVLANGLVATYQKEHGAGKYPEKVAFLLWAVETTRNKGSMEAEIFYLMGTKPIWGTGSSAGRISGVELIPGWDKPRVDVVVETSGSYRDTYSRQVIWINEAAKLAANAPDNGQRNFVKENSLEIEQALKDKGYNETFAKEISTARVFGPPPGEYTPGLENLAGSGNEGNESDVANLYISRMSYVYGVNLTTDKDGNDIRVDGKAVTQWGVPMPDLLKENLKDVEMGVFSRSSNTYGLLDHPMVASYFGGLASAIKESGGKPDMYINDQRNKGTDVTSLSEFLNAELNSRAFNPKWIEGMMDSGYAGTAHMNELFEALAVWNMAMPSLVTSDTWQKLSDIYVNDATGQGVPDHLKNTNPYAYQAMVGNLLNAAYLGQWTPSPDVLKQLEKEYVEQTALNGVVCCHHTCSNMNFNNKIMSGLMALDLPDDVKKQYVDTVNVALDKSYSPSLSPEKSTGSSSGTGTAKVVNGTDTGNSTENTSSTTPTDANSPGSGYGTDTSTPGQTGPQVSGFEMTVSVQNAASAVRDFMANPSVSSSSVIAIAIVVLIIGAIFYGYRKKGV
ncbi:hypothetical protein MsAc7_16060 [Methanolapillus millepedarum]|uniref:CobN/magnesium chelatase domain-containing protein n=2 Tax=Methanolapillus millepedarum TaxID=3028296 RepID=A0AA96V3Q4_9EURY|nr:hypothetical protein MsAc7_16060 [Methanosarcinaceae archaeon Ac7]